MTLYGAAATSYSTTVVRVSEAFTEAVCDYRLLLDRGYPESSVRDLVGDRHRLSRVERVVLYRGVSSTRHSLSRAGRFVPYKPETVFPLWVDTLNVLYTLANFLLGRLVFYCTDGWLRDAGEVHGSRLPEDALARAVDLLASLAFKGAGSAENQTTFVVDARPDITPDVCRLLTNAGNPAVLIRENADRALLRCESGVIASSDTAIIDHSALPVTDLSRHLLDPDGSRGFVDLGSLL